MQCVGNAPHDLIARSACEREGAQVRKHGHVARAARAHPEDACSGTSDGQGVHGRLLERVGRRHFLLRCCLLLGLRRRGLRGRRHLDSLAVLAANDAPGDDVPLLALGEVPIDQRHQRRGTLFRRDVLDEVEHVLRVHLARLRGHAARAIHVADDGDAIVCDVFLTWLCHCAIAAACGRQVDYHGPWFHVFDHVVLDEFRRRPARDGCRGDDDVALLAVLMERGPLRLEERRGRLLGVTACPGAVLFEVHLDPGGAHGRHLVAHVPDVPGADHRAEGLRRAHRGQPGDATAQDHAVGRRVLARRGDLRRVEALERVGRF
mmetsp:Transcript_52385/g.159213  ORF Transcript_52385/g.159213 Transcript_52385/m.159213 type:complete len:319 (-) Transcript_52385:613-1569(-)